MWTSALWRRFGVACASYSWEVIFSTLAVSFLAVTAVSCRAPTSTRSLCGNPVLDHSRLRLEDSSASSDDDDDSSTMSLDHKIDVFFLYLTRCAAIVYLFYQFRSLRAMGPPRYVMGVIAFFVLLAILAFFATVTSLLGFSFGTLGHFLPFFLLLMDLRKASYLAIQATSSETPDELVDNLAEAMEQIGPSVLLDTFVEIMVFSAASLSSYGLSSVKSISCFGSVSALPSC